MKISNIIIFSLALVVWSLLSPEYGGANSRGAFESTVDALERQLKISISIF